MSHHDLSALRSRLTVKLRQKTYSFDEPTLAQIAALVEASRPGSQPVEMAHQFRHALRGMVPELTDGDADYLLTPRVFEAFLKILTGETREDPPRGRN